MLRLISVVVLAVTLLSCSKSPSLSSDSDDGQQTTVSVAYLRSLYSGAVKQIEDNIAIEAFLVSNDRSGNFYHSMVFQDQTAGVELSVDLDDIYLYYTTHTLYKLSLKGLCIGESNGNIILGDYSADYPSYIFSIAENKITSYLSEVSNPSLEASDPEQMTIGSLTDRNLSCLVTLVEVGFAEDEVGLIANDTTAVVYRTLEDPWNASIGFYVSPYASFAGITLPAGTGQVNGIVRVKDGEYYIKCSNYSDIGI